jgi:hypothetical protein
MMGKVEANLEFWIFFGAEVGQQIFRPLVGLGDEDAAGIFGIHHAAHFLQEGVGFGQIFAVGAFALVQVGDGIDAEAVQPHVQPVADDVEHLFVHLGIVVVEVGLAAVEAVPEILPGDLVVGPVGRFGVQEDDAGVGCIRCRCRSRRSNRGRGIFVLAGGLEPGDAGLRCGWSPNR